MKKISLLIILIAGMFLASCYTDKSTLDINKIPGLLVDTTGIGANIMTSRYNDLKLEPKVTKDGKVLTDTSIVSYEWRLYPEMSNTQYFVVGKDKSLNMIVNYPIRANAYTLALSVTDKTNGIKYITNWNLFIQSSFREGLIVADTRDNSNSDISFIMDSGVSEGHSGPAIIKRDIFSLANGTKIKGILKNMLFTISGAFGLTYDRIIWAATDNSVMKLSAIDFSLLGSTKDVFIVPFSNVQPKAFYTASQQTLMVEGTKLYSQLRSVHKFWGYPIQNAEFQNVDYTVSKYIASESREQGDSPRFVWYDEARGKFWKFNGLNTSPKYSSFELGYNTTQPFNPSNLPGMTCKGAGMGDGKTFCFLLKHTTTMNYGIYMISTSIPDNWDTPEDETVESRAKAMYSIGSEYVSKLDAAVSTIFCPDQNLMYFATTTEIYAVNFNVSVPTVTLKYQAPAGELITVAKLFQQGNYMIDPSRFESQYGVIEIQPLPTNNRQLIIATYKQSSSEGVVRTLPMTDIGTGNLDPTKGKVYSGFGKITDITTQGI